MSKIVPCLWFDDEAEAAANFYVDVFKAMGQPAGIDHVAHFPEGSPRPAGMVMTVEFSLAGQNYIALNGGPEFTFDAAISLTIRCADQTEIDGYWRRLSDGGKEVQCGWLTDRYGLSWQVVPEMLSERMRTATPDQAQRTMAAVMGTVKLDIGTLEQAYAAG